MLLALALTVPSAGCTDALVAYANLDEPPPFHVLVYADATELAWTDAQNSSPRSRAASWVHDVHRFSMPPGSSNLSLRVTVELDLSGPLADERLQRVTVNVTGPDGPFDGARFTASGDEQWAIDGPVEGSWTVTVEGRGSGEVGVSASVRNDGSGL